MLNNLFLLNTVGLRLVSFQLSAEALTLHVASEQEAATCPVCGQPSRRVHSRYVRQMADAPQAGLPVSWTLQVRRFFCDQPACDRTTFAERLPEVVASRARRTNRLAEAQQRVGLALGGEAGARLAECLGMATSPDTLLRLIRKALLQPRPPIRVLGVDDWAWRRGQRYGTLLIDLEQHRPVDLLPDRESQTFAAWLRQHPSIEVITRDRAQVYIDGARQGAPQAQQVADRWHLLKNLREAVERFFDRHSAELKQVKLTVPSSATPPTSASSPISMKVKRRPLNSASTLSALQAGRQSQRQTRFEEVQALRAQGASYRRIAQTLKMSVNTVRRWLQMLELPPRVVPPQKLSKAQAYANYLAQRWEAGCHSPRQLWLEIRAQGFTGSAASVWRWLLRFRQQAAGPQGTLDVRPQRETPLPTYSLNSRQAAWVLVRQPGDLKPEECAWLEQMESLCPLVKTGRALAEQFICLVTKKQSSRLDDWLQAAERSGVRELSLFATSLRRDYEAVKAALSLTWSNGPTEGHVNRLKFIKRQMYGRAKFDLLRQRVLHGL